MQEFILILLIIIIAAIAGLFFYLFKFSRKEDGKEDTQSFLMLQNQINEIARVLDMKLGESAKLMQGQYAQSANIIRDVTDRLAKLDETNRQVVNFADQLQNLQDILQNPKQRGVLGEYFLETVLKNVLPVYSYKMQYKLGKDDEGKELIVDAAIILQDKIIPIDSKFSLENYNRIVEEKDPQERERLEKLFKQDLKNRIDETSKYINPRFGTMDFAIMFIPSEAIYYDLTINKIGAAKVNTQDLIQYATKEKRVHIVSPNSFYAFLQTILQGLRMMKIEESTKDIRKRVDELGRHLSAFDSFMKKLGTHLGASVGAYNSAYKEFGKVDKDVLRISGESVGVEPKMIEKPDDDLN